MGMAGMMENESCSGLSYMLKDWFVIFRRRLCC